MTLRGKDYCNCKHAHTLRKALEDVRQALMWPHSLVDASTIVDNALHEDHDACNELWGDMKEGTK